MLEEFLEDITVAGAPLVPQHKAYRMDGESPDMRKKAALGKCNCCDYFVFGSENAVILIEETRLEDQIRNLMNKYDYLDSTDKRDHVTKLMLQENRLKVYGSLLVLCRLFCGAADGAAASISLDTKYSFWLVASVSEQTDEVIPVDHLKDRLYGELRGLLSKTVMCSVEVVPAEALAGKLASLAEPPARPEPAG